MTDVVVIGGGLAGITAALDLADAGVDVTLVERKTTLGGATWSFVRDGVFYDNGQHVHLRACTSYLALLERLGVAGSTKMQRRLDVPLVSYRGRNGRLRRHQNLPAALQLAPSLALLGGISALDKAIAARAMVGLARMDPTDVAADRGSLGPWLSARGQSEGAIGRLWDLLIRATCNVPAADCSVAVAAAVVREGILGPTGAADIGWSRVPLSDLHAKAGARALDLAGVEVLAPASARELSRHGSGFKTVVGGRGGKDGTIYSQAVVVALPHDAAAALVAPLRPTPFAALTTSPIVNVQILYDRRVFPYEVAAFLDPPLQWVFDRSETAGIRPSRGQCVGFSLSAAGRWIRPRPQEVARVVASAFEAVFPMAASASILDAVVTKERRATFCPVAGSSSLRVGPNSGLDRLVYAGAWTATGWPATMEGATRSGRAAAAEVLSQLQRRQDEPASLVMAAGKE